MIPLISTIALAFVSFICSSFVILRIIIPVLPPHPLSRRVRPSEFGLPNFRSLSAADKSHVWLASCDILALAIFLWEAIMETLGGASGAQTASDPGSAARLWFALTLRQTCLLMVSAITLLHVRLGRPVSFGRKHWVIWAPMAVLVVTSTALAGVLAGAGFTGFFIGYAAYSASVAMLSTIAFGCLVGTLVIIKRNLSAINDAADPWPPAKAMEEKPRPSFATEDVDALRDGSSWITSRASSRHDSISAFSFSTHHTHNPAAASNPSLPGKSSFWFNPATPYTGHAHDSIPPVPQIPSPYRAHVLGSDPDPFRRSESPHEARVRMGSQSSWLTSTSGTRPTATAWSFPTSRPGSPHGELEMDAALASTQDLTTELLRSRPVTPGIANVQVLGGYGYAPSGMQAEKGLVALAAPSSDIDISVSRVVGWVAGIWVPLALALPYMFSMSGNVTPILLAVSVTISSPILALNIVFRHPILIPTGLFDARKQPSPLLGRSPSPQSTLPALSEYKRSTSMTVVEGRRSTDIWLAKGDAVDGKSRVGRALGMLAPAPKLSVLPPEEQDDLEPMTPPLPIQDDEDAPQTPHSLNSEELGRTRRAESKSSTYMSSADESLAFNTKIMVAQRHYSTMAMATTMVLPASPDRQDMAAGQPVDSDAAGVSSGVSAGPAAFRQSHLRTRSSSSVSGQRFPVSPPPSSPLPPTPPSIKNGTRLIHQKSYSSGFDFGAVGHDDVNEIDALSAGLLPLLVPGLRVGTDVRVKEGQEIPSPFGTFGHGSRASRKSRRSVLRDSDGPEPEFGGFVSAEFSSPEVHSTPYNRREQRARKTSGHKRHHFSLPSLALGKDGIHSLATWKKDVDAALEHKVEEYQTKAATLDSRRNTVWGGAESAPAVSSLETVQEHGDFLQAALARSPSGRNLGPRPSSNALADLPTNIDTARSSLAFLIAALEQPIEVPPASAGSEVTLFDLAGDSGPLAESTPPDYRRNSGASSQRSKNQRLSSIVYIKSDENENTAGPSRLTEETTKVPSPPGRFAQWSTRAVRPLVPKSSKLLQKLPLAPSAPIAGSPGGGLRPLSLLQDRNTDAAGAQSTRALSVGKKQKQKKREEAERGDQENAAPAAPATRKRLRSLKLGRADVVRSDTTKERAVLRAREVLPDVIVRPPSQSFHSEYAYTFR
ncbi:hypothetical protein BV25DRAFT_1812280 [Artomyces pyxidatus]|uniref:Uncharacterized protein n=1 Tax=Artomyces pyxidatus TaxID=48021 RepID=A0ACB8SMQ9_9AGAM|nr:hypothetical protein BV25DRAFT_1812280 [Artomyces pyxidatus]